MKPNHTRTLIACSLAISSSLIAGEPTAKPEVSQLTARKLTGETANGGALIEVLF